MGSPYHCYNCDRYGTKECIDNKYAHETSDDNIPLCFEYERGFRICLICGEEIENDDESLWGHIQIDHEEKFNEVQHWDTPEMIDEYYGMMFQYGKGEYIMYFSDNNHYIHYLINNKLCIPVVDMREFIKNRFKDELGEYIYNSLKTQYNNRHAIFKNNNKFINIYTHMKKTLYGIYCRKQLLGDIKVSHFYPWVKNEEKLMEMKKCILSEINEMEANLDLYIQEAKKLFYRKRDDKSKIDLTAYECFTIFNALVRHDKYNVKDYDDLRQKMLINLWNHASGEDKDAAILNYDILERMKYWDIPIR